MLLMGAASLEDKRDCHSVKLYGARNLRARRQNKEPNR